jgi:hypothetical protein
VITLVPHHPPRLPPRHPDCAQHPDLPCALEDESATVLTIPKRADDDRSASRTYSRLSVSLISFCQAGGELRLRLSSASETLQHLLERARRSRRR